MAAALETDSRIELRLLAGSPGALVPASLDLVFSPDRHLAYAAQWFGLCLVALLGYTYFGFKAGERS